MDIAVNVICKYVQIQEDAITFILRGNHVVQNIATGGGKTFAQIAANLFAESVIPAKFKKFYNGLYDL